MGNDGKYLTRTIYPTIKLVKTKILSNVYVSTKIKRLYNIENSLFKIMHIFVPRNTLYYLV